MSRRVAIIQARMGSSRLPGKVLVDLHGRPMLAHCIDRLRRCRSIDDVVIATSTAPHDEAIVGFADAERVRWYRGSEHDVLSRYLGAAREAAADVVVRVTGDCPLLSPEVVDRVVTRLESGDVRHDYASNTIQRTFPRGLDTEAFHFDVLARMARMATSAPAREHVTYFLHRERPDLFVIGQEVDAVDRSALRWTVDTDDDLAMMRALFAAMPSDGDLPAYAEVLALIADRPDIPAINQHVTQKVG